LTITDTGYGMLPEVRDSLFTEKAISRKAGGTGLGTKIVKDAIDDHGGTISVHSQQGVGTTFLITLPLTVPAPEIQAFEGPSVQEG
ncbi:MAG: ATP-binding protein, partial [Nitrospira sp.]|nr:ATP-binding protein [Nitrospira sp.]